MPSSTARAPTVQPTGPRGIKTNWRATPRATAPTSHAAREPHQLAIGKTTPAITQGKSQGRGASAAIAPIHSAAAIATRKPKPSDQPITRQPRPQARNRLAGEPDTWNHWAIRTMLPPSRNAPRVSSAPPQRRCAGWFQRWKPPQFAAIKSTSPPTARVAGDSEAQLAATKDRTPRPTRSAPKSSSAETKPLRWVESTSSSR
ncbi:hypothetical protein D3C72_1161570 [compost metagenome]